MNVDATMNPGRHLAAYVRLLWLETKRSIAPWFVPAAALIGWVYLWGRMQTGIITWPHTSLAIGLAGTVMLPLVAGIAAWVAGRERRRGLGDLLAATPHPALARDLVGWASVVLWSVIGYGVLAIVLVINTGVLGTWSGPVFWPMLVGALTIALGAAIGYAFGALIPSRFVPALLPIALAFGLGLPHTLGRERPSLRLLSPEAQLWPDSYSVFYGLSSDQALPFAIWLGGLIALSFSIIAVVRRRSLPALASVAGSVAVAVVGVWLLLHPADVSQARQVDYEPICATGVVTVCTHPAYERHLDDVSRALQQVFAPLDGIAGIPTRIEQNAPRPGMAERTDDVLYMYSDWFSDPDSIVVDVVSQLVQPMDANEASRNDDAGIVRLAIGRWLLGQTEIDPNNLAPFRFAEYEQLAELEAATAVVSARFTALSPAEQRAWLETHFADLRAGDIRPEDVP